MILQCHLFVAAAWRTSMSHRQSTSVWNSVVGRDWSGAWWKLWNDREWTCCVVLQWVGLSSTPATATRPVCWRSEAWCVAATDQRSTPVSRRTRKRRNTHNSRTSMLSHDHTPLHIIHLGPTNYSIQYAVQYEVTYHCVARLMMDVAFPMSMFCACRLCIRRQVVARPRLYNEKC